MAATFEQLIIELRLNGAQPTKQQLKDIKQEVSNLENAFQSLGTLGGVTYLLSQLSELVRTFAVVSGVGIAAEFRSVAYSLEAVVRNSRQASGLWRELRDLGNQIGVSPAVLGGTAARMVGSGVPVGQVMPELSKLMDLIAFSRVASEDIEPFLFNLQQIRGMGSAKANFADIRQMITRAPGIQTALAAGLGVQPAQLMSTLRGSSMSGSEVYAALMRGADAMARGAASARALNDPLFATSRLFQTLSQVMEPTGQILLAIGLPILRVAQGLGTLLLNLNQVTGGVFGLTALLGGALFLATRQATASLWQFVAAMAATSTAARAATGTTAVSGGATAAGGALAGGLGARLLGGAAAFLPRLLRGLGIGAVITAVSEMASYVVRGDDKNPTRSALGNSISRIGAGAGLGAMIGSVIPIVGTLAGGLIGAALGLGYDLYQKFSGNDKKVTEANPVVNEQKKTNKILEELKLQQWGGGGRTARVISDFEAQWAIQKAFAI